MSIFGAMQQHDYEQLVFCSDRSSGLKAIIAIHNTLLGPALGGCRMWHYATEKEAIQDALRLARGMTYKAAAAGLNLGGGKAVIIGNPQTDKNPSMFRALGRFIQTLNGLYITGEDVGTTVADMDLIHEETSYVTDISGSFGASGNLSPLMTAHGVFFGIRASVQEVYRTDSLAGKTVAVQGAGNVGYYLCKKLSEAKANVIVADIDSNRLERVKQDFSVQVVKPEEIYGVQCDIFAPCALGAVLNDQTIPQLKCKIVAGSANNQLADERHGDELHRLGILYAPDYLINAGGLIITADELMGYQPERARRRVESIGDTLKKIYRLAKQDHIPTYKVADRIAEQRIEEVRRIGRQWKQK